MTDWFASHCYSQRPYAPCDPVHIFTKRVCHLIHSFILYLWKSWCKYFWYFWYLANGTTSKSANRVWFHFLRHPFLTNKKAITTGCLMTMVWQNRCPTYIDAAFASYPDSKCRNGSVLAMIGNTPFVTVSTKTGPFSKEVHHCRDCGEDGRNLWRGNAARIHGDRKDTRSSSRIFVSDYYSNVP
jgi:hypothetical protein